MDRARWMQFHAILASLPSWTNESFIISSYVGNKVNGLPIILKKYGYQSAFFHGANNGSMRFDAFCKKIGFNRYYGKMNMEIKNTMMECGEYQTHYFFKLQRKTNNKAQRAIFLASIFTISSHHPYKIPKDYLKQIKKRSRGNMCCYKL